MSQHPTRLLLGLAACLSFSLPVHADSGSEPYPELLQSSRQIATELVNELGRTLKGTLSTDGPVAAVGVCKDAAPGIAERLSAQHKARVYRVGTRARNPRTGVPNDWQKEALARFETRMAAGEQAAALEFWQVADIGSGQRELRYAKAIAMQPICVTCHGKPEDMPAALAEKLRIAYPHDQATGYSAGQLRGAVVVTRTLSADSR